MKPLLSRLIPICGLVCNKKSISISAYPIFNQVPSREVDKSEQRFWSHWNKETKEFFLQFSFKLSDPRNLGGAPRPPPPAMVYNLTSNLSFLTTTQCQQSNTILTGASTSKACPSSISAATSTTGLWQKVLLIVHICQQFHIYLGTEARLLIHHDYLICHTYFIIIRTLKPIIRALTLHLSAFSFSHQALLHRRRNQKQVKCTFQFFYCYCGNKCASSLLSFTSCCSTGVSIISKNGVFYKSSYLRFEFLLGMQN